MLPTRIPAAFSTDRPGPSFFLIKQIKQAHFSELVFAFRKGGFNNIKRQSACLFSNGQLASTFSGPRNPAFSIRGNTSSTKYDISCV
jgi:hypothetical protein